MQPTHNRMTVEHWKSLVASGNPPEDALLTKYYNTEIETLPATSKEINGKSVEVKRARFVISTASVDRDRDTIAVAGWKTDNYKKNPVVLFGHDYHSLPVAMSPDVGVEGANLVATAEFHRGIYPFADMVADYVEVGMLRAASVGFKPEKWVQNENGGVDFIEQELLEWSIVPVPSNPEALQIAAKEHGIDLEPMVEWAEKIIEQWSPKAVPSDVSTDLAPIGESWSAPTLGDFTDQSWSDMNAAMKRNIAGHYAWSRVMPPESFGDLKLPHHRVDGKVVFRGIAAAMGALLGARGGVDIPAGERRAVYNHLARHYRAFDKEPPPFKDYTPEELAAISPEFEVDKQNQTSDISDMTAAEVKEILDKLDRALALLALVSAKKEKEINVSDQEENFVFELLEHEGLDKRDELSDIDVDVDVLKETIRGSLAQEMMALTGKLF